MKSSFVFVRVGLGLTLLAALASAQAQEVTSCPAGLEQTRLYAYTGNAPATFTVPARVTSVRLIAVGADGGERTPNPYQGGAGARVEGTFAVAPGDVITLLAGQAPPGANDQESGGGGASGAYLNGTLALIAGAGGGDDNTGNGGGGRAGLDGGNGGSPAGGDCAAGGLGGVNGAGGQFGEVAADGSTTCQTGDGGAGGGGFNSPGQGVTYAGAHQGPRGGGQCSINGASGGAGGTGEPQAGDRIGAAGGWGVCGGGGADDRESGGGGGYSGGGGAPESAYPGGGGSYVAASATSPTRVAGADGGGSGRNGSVRVCYSLRAELSVTKTNTPSSGPNDQAGDTLTRGEATSYRIVVSNAGPVAADGAVLRDPAAAGLTCTAARCGNASGGAICPTGSDAALLAALQSNTGLQLQTLPVGGALTFTVDCTVD
ncbi:DUF11 domain-containing protein [Pseudoxanthomonas winnipegensis]|uniref:DUF11 domain-containing protein n=1 Tax=Pseudoxanthomonas winnipegensis TaxID=2480810 RepID=A0A4Q8LVW6_9GAMM|nr:DUF11 domain-containing protein [Pseudoxanthomonas winnipegensis]RZZ85404.1 DUF11 domain-containing protein [Pseudoxanthomonas winnipegensis]TAA35649.1 DUF11 domain-containing protein [Pseudoxanthomonas winnipegensis]